MTKTEEVARAIWQESVGPAQWPEWDTWAPDAWGRVKSMAQARAAIKALKNPTPDMVAAYFDVDPYVCDGLSEAGFNAALDAALADDA